MCCGSIELIKSLVPYSLSKKVQDCVIYIFFTYFDLPGAEKPFAFSPKSYGHHSYGCDCKKFLYYTRLQKNLRGKKKKKIISLPSNQSIISRA